MYQACGIESLADGNGATEADAANCRAYPRGESTERLRCPVQPTVAAAITDFLEVCAPDLSVVTYRRRPLRPMPKAAAPAPVATPETREERIARVNAEFQEVKAAALRGDDEIFVNRDWRWTDGPPLVVTGVRRGGSSEREPVPMDHPCMSADFTINGVRPTAVRTVEGLKYLKREEAA
jgi:hypothetical protein